MEGSVNMDIEREDHEEKEIRERRGWEDVNCCSPSLPSSNHSALYLCKL